MTPRDCQRILERIRYKPNVDLRLEFHPVYRDMLQLMFRAKVPDRDDLSPAPV